VVDVCQPVESLRACLHGISSLSPAIIATFQNFYIRVASANQFERRTGAGLLVWSGSVEDNLFVFWRHPSSGEYGIKRHGYGSLDSVSGIFLRLPRINQQYVGSAVEPLP